MMIHQNRYQEGTTSDPIIINTIMTVAKNIHDSINSLSFADEIRQISQAVSGFIHKVRKIISILNINSFKR